MSTYTVQCTVLVAHAERCFLDKLHKTFPNKNILSRIIPSHIFLTKHSLTKPYLTNIISQNIPSQKMSLQISSHKIFPNKKCSYEHHLKKHSLTKNVLTNIISQNIPLQIFPVKTFQIECSCCCLKTFSSINITCNKTFHHKTFCIFHLA